MTVRAGVRVGFSVAIFWLMCLTAPGEGKSPGAAPVLGSGGAVEVLRAPLGSGPDDVGIETPDEGNPEGPMSFALGRDGDIYILDQVNSRIQVFRHGKRVKTVPLPAATLMDLEITPDNKIVVIDTLVKKSAYVLATTGQILQTIPLSGRLIPDPGGVTGVYCQARGKFSGIWVVVEDRSVRIASRDGEPVAERVSVPGQLSRDGRRLWRAEQIGAATAVVYRSREGSLSQWEPEWTVHFDQEISHLHGLGDDDSGNIYLAGFLESGGNFSNIMVILNPAGRELKRIRLAVQEMPHEIHRSLRVAPDGAIYQMGVEERGVVVRRYQGR